MYTYCGEYQLLKGPYKKNVTHKLFYLFFDQFKQKHKK